MSDIGSPGFRIGYRVFGSDHRIFGSGPLKFLKKPDPKFFPDTRSEISEILKSDRISEISDRIGGFLDRIFLHTLT